MVQKLFLMLVMAATAFKLLAQEHPGNCETVDSAHMYQYRLSKDLITSPAKSKVILLRSNDHFSKSNFLRELKVQLKSGNFYSSDLWTLDSIVVRARSESSEQIENLSRQTLSTQNSGQTMLVKDFNWGAEEGHWLIGDASYYSFSDEGRLDSIEFQEYVTKNYRLFTKTYYVYEDGLLKLEWSKQKFDEFDDWAKKLRMEYTYDSISLLKQVETLKWDDSYNRWSTIELMEYEYDSLGNIAVETVYSYDSYEMEKTKKSEIVYFYSPQNLLMEITEYVEGWSDGTFIPDRKLRYDYDALLNISAETLFIWDYDLDNWLENMRKTHFNGINNDQIHETLEQRWDNQWSDVTQTRYFAENSIVPDDVKDRSFVFTFLSMPVFNNRVVDKLEIDSYSDGEWLESGAISYHFEQNSPVGIETENQAEIKIYPNPATDYLTIKCTKLKQYHCIVYDLLGRMLMREQFYGDVRFDISSLKPSYYLIEIRDGDKKLFMERFIKI